LVEAKRRMPMFDAFQPTRDCSKVADYQQVVLAFRQKGLIVARSAMIADPTFVLLVRWISSITDGEKRVKAIV
jgi:hypothetical protein